MFFMSKNMQKDTTEFNTTQYDAAYPEGIEYHYWNIARNSIIQSVLKKNNLIGKKMLEIGCGRGYVVESLRAHGCDCVGVDRAVVVSKKEYLFFGIDFEELNTPLKESVEVILICDVLEHIPYSEEFLLRIRRTFPNMKYMLVTVPARQELWSNYDEYYGHMIRYSRPTLSNVLERAGYQVSYMSYFFHLLYFPAYVLTLLKRDRGIVVHSPKGLLLKAIHRLLAHLFVLEQQFFPRAVGGTSLICLVHTSNI